MESAGVDIKPTILEDDIPDKASLTIPAIGKLKHSRYEDVWPEDVHAAFMEAVALYPPMGKRRLKYYRVSMHGNEHPSNADRAKAKSFGRCQLIQSYILEKTGKNRSRKQVSSHLQRMKKIHKDNPAMQPLFSERSQPTSEHSSASQAVSSKDFSTDTPMGARLLKSDPDVDVIENLQNTDSGAINSSIFTNSPEALSFNGSPCNALNLSINFRDQPPFSSTQEFLYPVLQQCPAVALRSSNSDYLSELQDALLFKDAVNEGFRSGSAFNTSTFSTSMRRLASKLPMQARLVDSDPTMHFSCATHSLGFQPTHQYIPHDNCQWMDGVSCSSPFTSNEEAFHTPSLPLQLIPSEKRRPYPDFQSEWLWPKIPELPFDPREGSFAEFRFRYPPTISNPSCPDMGVNTPGYYSPPSDNEVPRLSRGISYSYVVTSPETVSESASNESTTDFHRQSPESSENLASPLVIRPTPVYPISYIHSDMPSSMPPDSRTPALSQSS